MPVEAEFRDLLEGFALELREEHGKKPQIFEFVRDEFDVKAFEITISLICFFHTFFNISNIVVEKYFSLNFEIKCEENRCIFLKLICFKMKTPKIDNK